MLALADDNGRVRPHAVYEVCSQCCSILAEFCSHKFSFPATWPVYMPAHKVFRGVLSSKYSDLFISNLSLQTGWNHTPTL